MVHDSFRYDLRRGLGSCHLELDRCSDIGAYKEGILWGCQNALAYDLQSEGTRGIYLFEMIMRFEDWSDFYTLLSELAGRTMGNRDGSFAHCTEILSLMAGEGYRPAMQTLEDLYETAVSNIGSGQISCGSITQLFNNFDYMCVSVFSYVKQSRAEKEKFFVRVLKDYGRMISQNPEVKNCLYDNWFLYIANEDLGEKRIAAIISNSRSDHYISLYLDNSNRSDAEQRRAEREQRNENAKKETAQSIYEKLRQGSYWSHYGKITSRYMLHRFDNDGREEETIKFGQLYAMEKDDSLRAEMLRLFHDESTIAFLREDAISRLLKDAECTDVKLRGEARRVLRDVQNDRVREYALERLNSEPEDLDALLAIITNYLPGDGSRIITLVKGVPVNEKDGDWHEVFSYIEYLIESDENADSELSAVLLPYMYREGLCSFCRYYYVEMMISRGLLTHEMTLECLYDCYMDTRELVENQTSSVKE